MSAQMPAVPTPDPCDHRTMSEPVVIRTVSGEWYTARWTVYVDQDEDGIPPCWELCGRDGLQLDPEEVVEWFYPAAVAELVEAANVAAEWIHEVAVYENEEGEICRRLRAALARIGVRNEPR